MQIGELKKLHTTLLFLLVSLLAIGLASCASGEAPTSEAPVAPVEVIQFVSE
jgi:hypothetical protein